MVAFTHVLYPTDLSESSRRAAQYAATISRWYNARLTVLHVVPTFEPMIVPSDVLGAPSPVVYPPSAEDVEAEMRRSLTDDAFRGLDVRFVPSAGDPVRVIVDRALSDSADLIVMGTHGRSGVDRLMTGSVTEKVLGRASCPVLTIPPHAPEGHAGHGTFSRILCPVDFSTASQQALGFALDLARQAKGSVTVMNVIEWLTEEDPRVSAYFNVDKYRRLLAEDTRERLGTLLADASSKGSEIEKVVTFGRAHREVLRVAVEKACDLIVMGAQGRGGVGLALFGSTTPPVIRSAACPVLVVRSPVEA